jgi:hypothetical protein
MSQPLIDALLEPGMYNHPVDCCELIETHISWVILAGEYAYKIKKPVNLGFLDFSTLEKRHFYCNEEVRLNARLAPDLYLEVVAISGNEKQPRLSDEGPVIEYMVKMKRFAQQTQLDRMLADDALNETHIDAIASMVADFHQQCDPAKASSAFGTPEQVYSPVDDNFVQNRSRLTDRQQLEQLTTIENWCRHNYALLRPVFTARKQAGFIRECHGDMHLRNLAWINNKPVAFDCIEFNPELRWIDVISEVAFLIMDLQEKNRAGFAQRFLNAYLEITGDYAGLQVLDFYLVYRALVRTKVEAIRLGQADLNSSERKHAEADLARYLLLASKYVKAKTPILFIMHGLSASGKSTVSQTWLELTGVIRIRSDVERKRLYAHAPDADSAHNVGEGIYAEQATQRTYELLAELANTILMAGFSVIVDATFLKAAQREQFRSLAESRHVPFIILSLSALPDTLRGRIVERAHGVSDANLTVLENQLKHWQPLSTEETASVIDIDTGRSIDFSQLRKQLAKKVAAQINKEG